MNYDGDETISIKQKGEDDITLQLPVEVQKWWNYLPINKSKIIESEKLERMKGSRQNVVMSYLEVTDANNQKINFVEKIVYGTRFPNEAEYSLRMHDGNLVTLKTDRTDKIFDFIIDCTYT